MSIKVDVQLDCKGLSCPMPIVRTKKAMDQLEPGQVIEVQATDPGSRADIQSWAKNTGHQYLGIQQEGELLKHYLRKAGNFAMEGKHPHVIQNEDLLQKLNSDKNIYILDVREPAEFAFGHIPGAFSIPLGDIENKMDEIPKDRSVYIICRTGTRSDMAAQLLARQGFENMVNVVPGMSEWTGPIDQEK